jgi:hypothetical protein
MEQTQAKIIELLREVHLFAVKEIERLNLRIIELENESHSPPPPRMATTTPKTVSIKSAPPTQWPEMLNETPACGVPEYSGSQFAEVAIVPQRAEVREGRRRCSIQASGSGCVAGFVFGAELTVRSSWSLGCRDDCLKPTLPTPRTLERTSGNDLENA